FVQGGRGIEFEKLMHPMFAHFDRDGIGGMDYRQMARDANAVAAAVAGIPALEAGDFQLDVFEFPVDIFSLNQGLVEAGGGEVIGGVYGDHAAKREVGEKQD